MANIRRNRTRAIIEDLRKNQYDVSILNFYYEVGDINSVEYNYIARKLAAEVRRVQQEMNLAALLKRLNNIRGFLSRHWQGRARREVQQILVGLPKWYRSRAITRRGYLRLKAAITTLARRVSIRPEPVKVAPRRFRLLLYRDLQDLLYEAMEAGEEITPEILQTLKQVSRPADFKRFLARESLLIYTYELVRRGAGEYYYEGEFIPTTAFYARLVEHYKADIKLGKLAGIWQKLWIIDDENNPLYTLLAKGGRKLPPTLKQVMRKTNQSQRHLYVFGLFEWVSPSEHPTYDLETGDMVIWGYDWVYKKGKKPWDYIQKVYTPIEHYRKQKMDGSGLRKVSQLEDTFGSRFIESKMLRFIRFLGLYVPVHTKR